MIYYAITVNAQDIVTGVHECATPFLTEHFQHSEDFKNDSIIPIESEIDGIVGLPLAALSEDYTPRPLEWLIENGYAERPPGFELIDGELIRQDAPAEELPPGIKKRLDIADARISALEAEIEKIMPAVAMLKRMDVVGLKQIEKPTSVKSK